MAQATRETPINKSLRELVANARAHIHRVIHGNEDAITMMLLALAARGHVLMEGIPGVGKTTLAKTFARVSGLDFARVQLTPDLMPTDITGHTYYDQKNQQFKVRKGPVFTNVLLADEINRTPPRTQAALLEVMGERQVTIEGTTHAVPDPFLVIATKNPIEVEGVYTLPEAELDRFMVQVQLGYPGRSVEFAMLQGKLVSGAAPEPLKELPGRLQQAHAAVRAHPDVVNYLLDVVEQTRSHPDVELGASPRASEQFLQISRANAALDGRDFVIPDDIKRTAPYVLSHRLLLTSDAEIQERRGLDVVMQILERTKVPIAAR